MAKKSSSSELGRWVDSKQVGMGTWLGVGARSNQSRSRFQKFVNGCNLPLILPYLLPWYWVTMNRRLDWEIRNAIETNTSVVNWEIHLRYTWYWVIMNRRLDWEIRNASETNTSVVKVRNTLDKNLAKLGEDTLSVPTAMLMNFFWVSQLILKIHAWAVPKMPLFGENGDIWPRYQSSKLKSRFLGTSFSRLTFFKVRRGPCLGKNRKQIQMQAKKPYICLLLLYDTEPYQQ